MSDLPSAAPRPVSTVTVLFILACLSVFFELVHVAYLKHPVPQAQNLAPDNLTSDLKWRATPAARRAYLAELREKQAKQAASYGWVDRQKGVVQLPIERAMELIVQENGGNK